MFRVVNVSNVSLLFVDAFNELTDKITQFMCVSVIQLPVYYANFIVIFRTVADISQIYRGCILIWATLCRRKNRRITQFATFSFESFPTMTNIVILKVKARTIIATRV